MAPDYLDIEPESWRLLRSYILWAKQNIFRIGLGVVGIMQAKAPRPLSEEPPLESTLTLTSFEPICPDKTTHAPFIKLVSSDSALCNSLITIVQQTLRDLPQLITITTHLVKLGCKQIE